MLQQVYVPPAVGGAIPRANVRSNYVGRCKIKLISAYFVDNLQFVVDEALIIQSQSLFNNPAINGRIIVAAQSLNNFNGNIEYETYLNGDIDVSVLEVGGLGPPVGNFDGMVLTIGITPI